MDYKKIDEKDVEYIQSIITDKERIFYGENINEAYCHDELSAVKKMPDLVVQVATAEEVSNIMRYAFKNRIPVTPRGSGTGLVGSAVPIYGGILIDLTKMNKILEIDKENLTLTVEPGVLLMDIGKYVEKFNLFYPPDPGEKTATIGGNISTNAGGMRAVKYGVTRDYVRGLEIVLPNGEIIEIGGKVVKNSSGYALKDLIIGSEGTLGIITKAVLKLLPLPKKVMSLLVPFPNLEMAINTVPEIIKSKSIPTAVEFMQTEVITAAEKFLGKKFPDKSSNAYLLLKFDGNSIEEIEKGYEDVARLCLEKGALDVLISNIKQREEAIWTARGVFLEAIKADTTEMDEVDVVVPRNRVADFVRYVHVLESKYKIRIRSFGHAGDGNLHVYILRDDLDEETWKAKLEEIMEEMYMKQREFRGQVSGEHGIGLAKKTYLNKSLSSSAIKLMRGIKGSFDPCCILNPGKIF